MTSVSHEASRHFADPISNVLDHAPFAVTLLDSHLRLRGYNKRAERLFRQRVPPLGCSLGELVPHLWPETKPSELIAHFEYTLATGVPYDSPAYAGRTPAEAYEWRIQRITRPDGTVGLACYARDVTLLRHADAVMTETLEHDARYRALFASIDEGFALIDVIFDAGGRPVDLRILETNAAFDRQTGLSGMAGQTVLARLPTFEHHWIDALARVALTGESARIEGTVETVHRSFEVLAARVGADGSHRLAVVFKDVSARAQAEAALRASEARHEYLLELSDALRSRADPVEIQFVAARVLGSHLAVSRALYAEVESIEGDDYYVVGPDYCAPGVASITGRFRARDYGPAMMEELRRGSTLVNVDVTKDPHTCDHPEPYLEVRVHSYVAVPLLARGQHVALVAVHQAAPRVWTADDAALVEATGERTRAEVQRARAEARQRETEARLQLALAASDMGTFVWHVEQDCGEPDARTLKLFGLPLEAKLNFVEVVDHLTHPADRARLAAAVRTAMDPHGTRTLHQDFRVVHADGSVHWLAATGRMVFDEGAKRAVRLVGMLADVTERKSIEAALREREERLKESDRRKDEFLAILGHELRTPLAPIRTGLELIRMTEARSDEMDGIRTMMERQVEHMVRLVDDLLDVSRIRSGKIRLRRKPSSLPTLVDMAVDANRAALNDRDIALRIVIPADLPLIDVDPTRFVQVLSNVLHNAVKFTDVHGRIEINAAFEQAEGSRERTVALTVMDNGVGMSREMLARAFDLFTQGEDAQRSQAGLGIGLALARRLVELHGGSVEARSDGLGRGSAFTIRLPLRAASPELPPLPAPARVPCAPRRVVVIDDNVDAANALKTFVAALGGDCRVAYDGARGLETVREFQPELVLLDLGMPRVNGYETCRQIRHALGTRVVVVAITGWGQAQDKKAAMRAGFDVHLTKPVDPAVLRGLLTQPDAPSA